MPIRDYSGNALESIPNVRPDSLNGHRVFSMDLDWVIAGRVRYAQIEARIVDDRFYAWLDRTWMAQHLPWVVIFGAWGGWGFVLWGVCARLTACMFGHWAIGYLAHNHRQVVREVRGAAVQGRNVRLASLLTMGECWHNNHHAFPESARLGLAPDEWDPGWWVLLLLKQLGLVWSLRLP
jgi:stearoyl-CoA desaturase (delta-9 desaturase)